MPCDVQGLLSRFICLMKFHCWKNAFEEGDVLHADGAALHVIVVIVSGMMISVNNTCVWGTRLLHYWSLPFGLLCTAKCFLQLSENQTPRLAAFISHHLSKDGIIIISAPCEVCLSGNPRIFSHLAAPASFPFIKVAASFSYVYFLSLRYVAVGLPSENPEGIEPELWMSHGWILRVQRTRSGWRFHYESDDL